MGNEPDSTGATPESYSFTGNLFSAILPNRQSTILVQPEKMKHCLGILRGQNGLPGGNIAITSSNPGCAGSDTAGRGRGNRLRPRQLVARNQVEARSISADVRSTIRHCKTLAVKSSDHSWLLRRYFRF